MLFFIHGVIVLEVAVMTDQGCHVLGKLPHWWMNETSALPLAPYLAASSLGECWRFRWEACRIQVER
jgi:hypothetical protein